MDDLVSRTVFELTDLERELLLGKSGGWGSWMFECGSGLVAKGLGSKRNGSIYFDTLLAKQVIDRLTTTDEVTGRE